MVLAELEVFHSRPVAPTRRVALGHLKLPVEPPPGFGGILLGAVAAANIGGVDPDLLGELDALTHQLELGQRVPQPRLRHRFQKDKVGLQRSRHQLVGHGEELSFHFDDAHGDPAQMVLGAVYAAGTLPPAPRRVVMASVRRGIGWVGGIGPELISVLGGSARGTALPAGAIAYPVEWALTVLGLAAGRREDRRSTADILAGRHDADRVEPPRPPRPEIQRRYRELLKAAHPDHGGETAAAAQRIAELTEARRILLG